MDTFTRLAKSSLLIIIFMVLAACGGQPETPADVSSAFWKAVIKNDQDAAKALTLPISAHHLATLHNDASQLKSVEFGEPQVTENKAVVETTLYGLTDDGEKVSFPTTTHLVKYDEGWRVEAEQTVAMLNTGSTGFEEVLQELGQTFSVLGQQLSDAFNQGVEGFSESMEETLPEINQQLEELQQSDKFKNMGSQLGKVLGEGLKEFTQELNEGLEELNAEVEKAAAEIDAANAENAQEAEVQQ